LYKDGIIILIYFVLLIPLQNAQNNFHYVHSDIMIIDIKTYLVKYLIGRNITNNIVFFNIVVFLCTNCIMGSSQMIF